MKQIIYLCRHGETEWTISGQHTSRTDISLTETGEMQAVELRKRLEGLHFDQVISSPRKRALQTCAGLNPIIDPLAQEWDYGDYEGLKDKDIQVKSPGWSLFKNGAPHGETPEQVGKRADALLSKLHGTSVIFSHGHFLRVLAARFLGLPVEAGRYFYLSVATISILGFHRDQKCVKLWNSTDGSLV